MTPLPPAETRLERDGPVGRLVFSHPRRRNALTPGMLEQARQHLAVLAADPDVRVVVLTGDGEEAFVSGADISGFAGDGAHDPAAGWRELTEELQALPKPVVALLRGWCLGGGVWVALAADLRLAAEGARFGIPAARLGIAYPPPAVRALVRVVGAAVATELLLTGATVTVERAHDVGLVTSVLPAAGFDAEAARVLDLLAGHAPLSLAASKRAVAAAVDPGQAEAAEAASRATLRSADFAEGQRAFAEKRAPRFTGT